MTSRLVQYTGVHFADLNPNSYDINNMKFDLTSCTKVKFNAYDQGFEFKSKST